MQRLGLWRAPQRWHRAADALTRSTHTSSPGEDPEQALNRTWGVINTWTSQGDFQQNPPFSTKKRTELRRVQTADHALGPLHSRPSQQKPPALNQTADPNCEQRKRHTMHLIFSYKLPLPKLYIYITGTYHQPQHYTSSPSPTPTHTQTHRGCRVRRSRTDSLGRLLLVYFTSWHRAAAARAAARRSVSS